MTNFRISDVEHQYDITSYFLHLVLKSMIEELYLHSTAGVHGIVLN
jgi:hypothetical protein